MRNSIRTWKANQSASGSLASVFLDWIFAISFSHLNWLLFSFFNCFLSKFLILSMKDFCLSFSAPASRALMASCWSISTFVMIRQR